MSVVWEKTVDTKEDVQAALEDYARRRHTELKKRWRTENPQALREMNARYRAKHKKPIRITYTPPPTTPRTPVPDWRTQLDARISRCPGCDQWCWDRRCNHCMTQINRRTAA